MNRRIFFLPLCATFLSFAPVSIAQNDQVPASAASAPVSASPPEDRPYRFAFNIVDFQHRYENKGEYGFVTADGMYHETAYGTDKNDNFVVTRTRYGRIKTLKDAQGILKNRAKGGRKLVEAIARACGACRRIGLGMDKAADVQGEARGGAIAAKPATSDPLLERVRGTLIEKKRDDASARERSKSFKDARGSRRGKGLIVRNVIEARNSTKGLVPREWNNSSNGDNEDVRYRFNYTISSHGHREDGYVSGKKDERPGGEEKGRANEFRHQPNVSTFVNATNDESQRLKGSLFLWY